jgi:hypothetical protein
MTADATTIFLLTEFKDFLADFSALNKALVDHRHGKESAEKLENMLQLVETFFEILKEIGLKNQCDVYHAVKNNSENVFSATGVWHTCHISGCVSCDCLQVSETVFVHQQYNKWLQCLWLTTHVGQLEQSRFVETQSFCIPDAHVKIYQTAMQFVIEQIVQLHTAVKHRLHKQACTLSEIKKNNVFACSS